MSYDKAKRLEVFNLLKERDKSVDDVSIFNGYMYSTIHLNSRPSCYACWSDENINAYYPKDENIYTYGLILCESCADAAHSNHWGVYHFVREKNAELTTSIKYSADNIGDNEIII